MKKTTSEPTVPVIPLDPFLAQTQACLAQMADESRVLHPPDRAPLTDTLAGWLAAEYAVLSREDLCAATGPQRRELLRAFIRDWHLLRSGDQATGRLQLGRDNLAWRRENGLAQKEQQFREWRKRPENELREPAKGITPETLEEIDRILGMA